MPELPDVAVFKKYLDSTALHQKIQQVEVKEKKVLEGVSAEKLQDRLEGTSFEKSRRHGKYLFIETAGGGHLVLHFGMTGFLKYFEDMEKEPDHDRLLFDFSNGYHLAFDCQRMFGQVEWADSMADFIEEKGLGPDALSSDLSFSDFRELFSESGAMIKSALMNQRLIAGIGNIYSDEILFQAGIHPKAKPKELDKDRIRKLYETMRKVLETAIEHRADPEAMPNHFMLPHRKKGEKCPGCGGEIEKEKIAGRTAYFCPKCQK
jgi:formamidopyrimidine-DNA glycosylase